MASPGNQHCANCVAAHFRSLSVFADSLQLTVGCTESSKIIASIRRRESSGFSAQLYR